MYKTLLAGVVLSLVFATPVTAKDADKTAAPAKGATKCRVAEVHPITGHLECVDPPGAPIEQPKKRVLPPCPPEKAGDTRDKNKQDWVVRTNCVKPDGKPTDAHDPDKHDDQSSGED